MTTGAKYNISGTGFYDGNRTITVVDGTHVKISVAFAGNATGNLAGAGIIDTMAHLLSLIDGQNQTIPPTPYMAVSSGVNYQMTNTPPLVFDFTPTTNGLSVTLPQANLPGSMAKGRPTLLHNAAGSTSVTLKTFGGNTIFNVLPLQFVELYLTDNGSQAGTITQYRVLETARANIGDVSTTLGTQKAAINVSALTSVLASPRTWTLPPANALFASTLLLVEDAVGGVTSTNTLSVARAGADKINGSTTSIVLNRAYDWVLLETDGLSAWTIIGGKGALASTDLSDLPIPVLSGGTGDTGAAWTTYSPTVASGTGALTTASATGRYKTLGKTVLVEINVTITTNGTGGGWIEASLPGGLTPAVDASYTMAGSTLQPRLCGVFLRTINGNVGGPHMRFFQYDGTYPGADGRQMIASGVYESA
jgi:hypothetical protein